MEIHLCLHLQFISRCRRSFEDFRLKIFLQTQNVVSLLGDLFKLLSVSQFLKIKFFHFPLKIFVSSKIFKECGNFEDLWRIFELMKILPIHLWRIFELMKILPIHLWSIFKNWRIFVLAFSPFSIFVGTLIIFVTFYLLPYQTWIRRPDVIFSWLEFIPKTKILSLEKLMLMAFFMHGWCQMRIF